jgi:FAD:protein FMN transferase
MGTSFLIVVHENDSALVADAVAHIEDLERRWSRFLPGSEISVLNRSSRVPVIVSPDTFQVIQAAVEGSEATGGRFDPTVHDTMIAVGYDRSFDEMTATDVAAPSTPVAAPGTDGIRLDDDLHAVTLPSGVRLDLGGIGKGSAADRVTEGLLERGARGAAVSIGGDLRVCGESPNGPGWTVSYEGRPLPVPPILDGGVCTSTINRRRWTTRDGEVHHIVDPRTGRPTSGDIESVTVIGATAQQAEVLTKAAMVAGAGAAALLETHGVTAFVRRRAST